MEQGPDLDLVQEAEDRTLEEIEDQGPKAEVHVRKEATRSLFLQDIKNRFDCFELNALEL